MEIIADEQSKISLEDKFEKVMESFVIAARTSMHQGKLYERKNNQNWKYFPRDKEIRLYTTFSECKKLIYKE